jgi:vesicle-fusing ATPase
MISAESMVGMSEAAKCHHIAKLFDDAYKSPLSFIILDDIERLLEYVPIGPRFSNAVLQTILVLLKKPPPEGRRLFVMGTTSASLIMEDMGVSSTFNVLLHVPQLSRPEMKEVLLHLRAFSSEYDTDIAVQEVPEDTSIKKLLLLLDLARQGLSSADAADDAAFIPINNWTRVIRDLM